MQLLAKLIDHVLKAQGERATIIGATPVIRAPRRSKPLQA